jgi:putative redox protein
MSDAPAPRPPNVVRATWVGEHSFEAGRPGGPTARIDGSGRTAQSPPDALLSAVACCSGIDVVDILAKRRTPVERLEVNVTGYRVETTPRRYHHVVLEFLIDGAGIDRAHAERAVELSLTKYCSVHASLDHGILTEWSVVLNGEQPSAGRAQVDATSR